MRLFFKLVLSLEACLQIPRHFIHRTCSNLSGRSAAREKSADGEPDQARQMVKA
jgi:hypothetical protein